MAPRGNLRRDHLRFLGITEKTRRCYEKAVLAFFKYVRPLRGRMPKSLGALDDALAENIIIIFTKKAITSRWLDARSVASAPFFLSAVFTWLLLSCFTGTGKESIFLKELGQCPGWVPKLWQQLLTKLAARTLPSWFSSASPSFWTMELVSLHFHHVRLFQEQGTVVIAIINSKNFRGLQQYLFSA